MRQRQKTYFVAAWCKVNSALKCSMKNARKLFCVTGRNVFKTPNHFVAFRMQPEERSCARDLERQTLLFECGIQSGTESLSASGEQFKSIDALDLLQRCQAGTHADGIGAQCPRLINRPGRRNHFHQVPATAVRADGKAAADYFAIGYEIRTDVEHFGHSTHRYAKSRDDFVENNKRAMLSRDVDCLFNELATLKQQTVIGRLRFENYRGDLRSLFGENSANVVFVVKGGD